MTRQPIFGWLTPSGRFVQCPLWNHVEIAREDEEFLKVPKVREQIDKVEDAEQECRDLQAMGEHPEWHTAEVAWDRARTEIRRALLRAKFIRIGEHDGTLFFQGFPNILKRYHQRCKDLADNYDLGAKFEPIRNP